jgi:two-component system, response regulator YesN
MNKAKELLEDASLSIKEICTMSGYSDPNYFSRIFKKIENVTPSEFREKGENSLAKLCEPLKRTPK